MAENVGLAPMKDLSGYLTPEQVELLIDGAENQRDRCILIILSKTSRRIGEVLLLQGRDIRWEEGMIEWTILKKNPRSRRDDGSFTPKALPVRKVKPVRPEVLQAIRRYMKDYQAVNHIRDNDYLFNIQRDTFRKILLKIGKKVGIEKVGNKPLHPHHLRHSFLVHAARKAKNPAQLVLLKDIAEHSRIETTMHYLQFNPQEQRELLDAMFGREREGNKDAKSDTQGNSSQS